MAKELIRSNANVNIQDRNGMSALHAAVMRDDCSIVQLLLDHGANVNILDIYGNNPSFRVATNEQMIRLLIQHGCDFKRKNKYGVSSYDKLSEKMKQLVDKAAS